MLSRIISWWTADYDCEIIWLYDVTSRFSRVPSNTCNLLPAAGCGIALSSWDIIDTWLKRGVIYLNRTVSSSNLAFSFTVHITFTPEKKIHPQIRKENARSNRTVSENYDVKSKFSLDWKTVYGVPIPLSSKNTRYRNQHIQRHLLHQDHRHHTKNKK